MSFTSETIETTNRVQTDSKQVALANAFHALSIALGPPSDMQGTEADNLFSAFDSFNDPLRGAGACVARELQSALVDRDSLSVAYAQLFLGPFEILAPPYASSYMEPDHRMMGDVARQVAEMYADAGLEPHPENHQPPDHICCELEFMYFLTFQFLETGDSIWLQRRESFFREHLILWLDQFARTVATADVHPFYNAIGNLLSLLANDSDLLTTHTN